MNGAPTLYAGQPVRQVAVSQAVDIRPTGVRPAGKQPAGNVCPTCAKVSECHAGCYPSANLPSIPTVSHTSSKQSNKNDAPLFLFSNSIHILYASSSHARMQRRALSGCTILRCTCANTQEKRRTTARSTIAPNSSSGAARWRTTCVPIIKPQTY